MIRIENLSKKFDSTLALDGLNMNVPSGSVYGLVGTNGAGKTTIIKHLAGVLRQNSGTIQYDDEDIWENEALKSRIGVIHDELYFPSGYSLKDMRRMYKSAYPKWNDERFHEMTRIMKLDETRRIKTFSKGMKKQLSIILGLSAMTKYIFCDETFDGLDPVMRQAVKSLFASDMAEREFTPIIASHNLRELEDICDTVGLLHKGGMLMSEDLDEVKGDVHKIQVVFPQDTDTESMTERLRILENEKRGSLLTLIVRGREKEIKDILSEGNPVFMESLPLSLEEIFITSTGVEGYDIKKIIY